MVVAGRIVVADRAHLVAVDSLLVSAVEGFWDFAVAAGCSLAVAAVGTARTVEDTVRIAGAVARTVAGIADVAVELAVAGQLVAAGCFAPAFP